MEGAHHAPSQAAAPSVPGCPSVPHRWWPMPRSQPRQRTGLSRGSPARLGQSWQQSGSCPTSQCSKQASGAACLSASDLFASPASSQLPLPPALASCGGAWLAPPDALSLKPAHPSPFLLASCQAGGNKKPQSSCSQLLRHIWIAMRALLLLLLLLFTLCRHVGFYISCFLSPHKTHHVFSLFVCHP